MPQILKPSNIAPAILFLALFLFAACANAVDVSELDSALADINGAVSEDDDTVFVRPTKNPDLCAAAIKVAVSRCKSKGIESLTFLDGEYKIRSGVSKPAKRPSAENNPEEMERDIWDDFIDFFDIDSDGSPDIKKSYKGSPLVAESAILIEDFSDFTIDASKARFLCEPSRPAFAVLNCNSVRANFGEVLPRKSATASAIVFAGCKGVSATVNSDSSSPVLFFSNCSNAIVKDSNFKPETGSSPSAFMWMSMKGKVPSGNKSRNRLRAVVEFESCRILASVRSCSFEGAEIPPVLVSAQCAVLVERISDARAKFELKDPSKETIFFASKGDEIALLSKDGGLVSKAKISNIKMLSESSFELEFDSRAMASSKSVEFAYNSTSAAKLSFSHNKLTGCYAPVSVSSKSGADFVSNEFRNMRGTSGVELLSNPPFAVCAPLQSARFVRNAFESDGAVAIASDCSPHGDSSVFKNISILRNKFKVFDRPATSLSRASGISFSENEISSCEPESVVLSFEKCSNISITENSFSGGRNLRIADEGCSGKMSVSENTGANLIVKKIFK